MRKLPYMQFYVADYQADTRCLSLAARGAWMDILCCLWRAPKRGQRTLSLEGWAGEIGKSVAEVTPLLAEIRSNDMGVFYDEIDGKLTISSRRMLREERIRRGATTRKQHQRDRRLSCLSHVSITAVSPPSHREISEIRSQTSEVRNQSQQSEVRIGKRSEEEELRGGAAPRGQGARGGGIEIGAGLVGLCGGVSDCLYRRAGAQCEDERTDGGVREPRAARRGAGGGRVLRPAQK